MNNYTIVDTLDPERWNKFVDEHPKGSIFHTSYMVEVFKGTKNNEPLFLAALDNAGEVLALLVAVRVKTLPGPLSSIGSRSIFYAEPLCREDALGVEALAALVKEHDRRMRNKVLFTEVRPIKANGPERTALERSNYQYEDYLNYLIDLRRPADELWSSLSNTCRANIRRSQKKGVKLVDMTTPEGVDVLYHFLDLTYALAKVPLADKSMFAEAVRVLQPLDMVRVFGAYLDESAEAQEPTTESASAPGHPPVGAPTALGTPIAACIVLLYKKVVYEWYWGVERTKSVYPAESITWHRIEWGHQNGYDQYDFGGAGWPNKPYGVRDFKAKFGGELVHYGRYRRIYSPWKFALAETGYEFLRNGVKSRLEGLKSGVRGRRSGVGRQNAEG